MISVFTVPGNSAFLMKWDDETRTSVRRLDCQMKHELELEPRRSDGQAQRSGFSPVRRLNSVPRRGSDEEPRKFGEQAEGTHDCD